MGIFHRKPNIEKLEARKNTKGLIKALKYNKPVRGFEPEAHYFRCSAASALGKMGDKRTVEPLIEALRDSFSDVRYHAAGALGEIGDSRAVEPLIEALGDEDYEVRGNAALALGKIEDKRAVEPFIKVLKDKDRGVRMRATEALDQLGWIPKDDSEKIRYLIAKKQWDELVKLGEPAVGSLIETLEDEDINIACGATIREALAVGEGAARALGEIGDKRAVEPLTKALKDGDESIRRAAKNALEKIKTKKI